ncbi:MAG: hypothetical protein AAGG08_14050, partial [Actinomycetota bacterium]
MADEDEPADDEPVEETTTTVEESVAETTIADPCDDGLRLFDDPRLLGDPVCVPEQPQRIIPIGFGPTELMLLTDIEFVAGAGGYTFFITNTHPEWAGALEAA